MNILRKSIVIGLLLAVFAPGAWAEVAGEKPSPELIAKGQELFHKKEGLKVKYACILCHKNEKAIERSAVEKLGDALPSAINKYLTTKSKGKAIAADSEEMKALAAYIRYDHAK